MPPERFLGKTVEEVLPPQAAREIRAGMELLKAAGGPIPVEYSLVMNGEEMHFDARLVSYGDDRILAYRSDITARKRNEMALRSMVEEKNTLIMEIHHRVKNNLQLILSLLNLQANKLEDPSAQSALIDIIQRIYSIAEIHENIYQSDNLSNIDFYTYLHTIAHELLRVYAADPARVRVTLDIHDARLKLNKAIPCGLLVNELLGNAIKHNGRGPGESNIELRFLLKGSHYVLIVQDDGPGIPENVLTAKEKTLGMKIIEALCDQLGASVSIERNGGTRFHITIPA